MKKINFQNPKGKRLVGVLHSPKEKTDKIVIICHGFTANKDRDRLVKIGDVYAENGIAALRFDFGGSGESYDTAISIGDQVDDLKSAIEFVKSKGYKNIGLQGESLGGLIAILVNSQDVKTMVLWAPVTKGKDKIEILSEEKLTEKELEEKGYFIKKKDSREFKIPRKYFEERVKINQKELLLRIKCPVLILHGDKDDTVPLEHSKEAVKILQDARLEIINGGGHKLDEKIDVVSSFSVNWFKKHL